MSQLQAILQSELLLQLSRACFAMLIHSVWLGLLLSMVSGIFLVMGRRFSPSARYSVLLAAFLLFLAGCGYAFVHEWASLSGGGDDRGYVSGIQEPSPLSWFSRLQVNAPLVVSVWFAIFLANAIRLTLTLALRDPRRQRCTMPAPTHWQERLATLADRIGIRKAVTLLESAAVNAPVLAGYLKPVILVPAGLLASLPPDQVEAVLLHELAHIRRNDYLVNLLQGLAEAVFFFNPGLLWVSRQLREEREHCCDDLALQQIADRMTFVHALIGFKEYALYRNRYPLAFSGSKDQLFTRVNRIVGSPVRTNDSGRIKTLLYRSSLSILVLAAMIYIHRPSRLKANTTHLPEIGIWTDSFLPLLPQPTAVGIPAPLDPGGMQDHRPEQPGFTGSPQAGAAPIARDSLPVPKPPKPPEPINIPESMSEPLAPQPAAPEPPPGMPAMPSGFSEKQQAAMELYRQGQEKYLGGMQKYKQEMEVYDLVLRQYADKMELYREQQGQYAGGMKKYQQDMEVYNQALRQYAAKMKLYRESSDAYRKDMKEYERNMQQYRKELEQSLESPGKNTPID